MKNFIYSFAIFFAGLVSFSFLNAESLDTSLQPTIGASSAKVEVVAFLEPKCPDSKTYNNQSFPKLKTEYIDTNKIRYTVITTSFLSNSLPAANALLCVYNQNPNNPNANLFFDYLNYIYQVQPPERQNWATKEVLMKFASKANPQIDQTKLEKCIESNHYQSQVKKNTAYGNKLMGHIHTPTIFVNGVQIENKDETIDYDKLKIAIEQALQK